MHQQHQSQKASKCYTKRANTKHDRRDILGRHLQINSRKWKVASKIWIHSYDSVAWWLKAQPGDSNRSLSATYLPFITSYWTILIIIFCLYKMGAGISIFPRGREKEKEVERERASSLVSLLIRTLIPSDQDRHPMTSFNLNYLVYTPYLQIQPHCRVRALGDPIHSIGNGNRCMYSEQFEIMWLKLWPYPWFPNFIFFELKKIKILRKKNHI